MQERAEAIFREHGGQLRMSEALDYGITPYMLYVLRDRGVVEPVSRGIYRLAGLPPLSNPDLVTVSLRYPNAVICLVSALAFHDVTTQIPHKVSVAVPRGSRLPSLEHPLPCGRIGSRRRATMLESKRIGSTVRRSRSMAAKRLWPTASSFATGSAWTSC